MVGFVAVVVAAEAAAAVVQVGVLILLQLFYKLIYLFIIDKTFQIHTMHIQICNT